MAINNNSTIGGVAETAAYKYDNLGRLVTSEQTSNGQSAQRRFAYDRFGNRTGVWYATSGGNQIQAITLATLHARYRTRAENCKIARPAPLNPHKPVLDEVIKGWRTERLTKSRKLNSRDMQG